MASPTKSVTECGTWVVPEPDPVAGKAVPQPEDQSRRGEPSPHQIDDRDCRQFSAADTQCSVTDQNRAAKGRERPDVLFIVSDGDGWPSGSVG